MKNLTIKISLLIAISSILVSCGILAKNQSNRGLAKKQKKIKAQIGYMDEGDPIQIEDVKLEGNTLIISVSYGGGCGEHSFKMNGSSAIIKSYPYPTRRIKLIHTNHGDYCKSIVREIIEVYISELSSIKKLGSKTILLLDGWNEKIEYQLK